MKEIPDLDKLRNCVLNEFFQDNPVGYTLFMNLLGLRIEQLQKGDIDWMAYTERWATFKPTYNPPPMVVHAEGYRSMAELE